MARVTLFLLLLLVYGVVSEHFIVETLPGFHGKLPFTLETGYISVGEEEKVQLFYFFVQSERDPRNDPLMIWLTGGPGCSGLSSFVYEIGPLTFDYANSTGNFPKLELNSYSWTKVANIIFIDQPAGTGYSYANTSEAYNCNDTLSVTLTYDFLRKWLMDHPAYLNNPLYVGGDSYSGIFVALLTRKIYDGIEVGDRPRVNIKGYIQGNALTDRSIDFNGRVKYANQRFHRLIDFSIDHDWCAVVKKLLDVFFNGVVDVGQQSSLDIPLQEVGILHRAVRRKCRSMIDVLLKYRHHGAFDKSGLQTQQDDRGYLFRPDAVGPGGLTPLHVVASLAGYENILDALVDDPGQVGIEAWKSARDSTGLTPNDYACLRGHYSYVHMVQKKINQKPGDGHVVLDIPGSLLDSNLKQKLSDGHRSVKVTSFQTEKSLGKPIHRQCKQCKQKLSYGNSGTSLVYKPAMLSMVAIAAICVCVALLFKSSPEVLYSFRPFRWELLKYGSI